MALAILLYLVGRPVPIIVWDEGRIIINAMEMRNGGIGLATIFGDEWLPFGASH